MMKTQFYRVAPACFTLVCGTSAMAAVIASDDFNSYTDGALSPQSGGTGWSAAGWTAPTAVTGTTTTSATVVDVSGNKKVTAAAPHTNTGTPPQSASTVVAGRVLTTALVSTFYVSYKVAYTGSSPDAFDNNNTFGLILSNLAAPNVAVASNVLNFGMRSSTGTDSSATERFSVRGGTGVIAASAGAQTTGPGSLESGTIYTLLAKVVWDGTDFSQIDMWVNPTSLTETAAEATFSLGATAGVTSISTLYFRQAANQSGDTYQFDDLIVAQEWADVVPEPGTVGLLGLSLCGLLGLRTRDKR